MWLCGFPWSIPRRRKEKNMENDDYRLRLWECSNNVVDVGEGEELGLPVSDEKANDGENKKRPNFDGENSEDLLGLIKNSENQSVTMAVNLNVCVDGEASHPSSSTIAMEIDNFSVDTQKKRPKIRSFSMGSGTNSREEIGCEDVPDSSVAGEHVRSASDNLIAGDTQEVRVELDDDILYRVFSFLNLMDLCNAAQVCRHWRDVSSSEDLWCYLNFENHRITEQQFEDMCHRYPNATAVNVYGTHAMYRLVMNAFSLLRNLKVLTVGRGQLRMDFFKALTDCQTLRILTINDATMGTGVQEIHIYHDRLHGLQIVECQMIRVSISCPKLETLSLKRCCVPKVVLNCPLLRGLDIAACHMLTDAEIRSAATSCPLLESLDMAKCSSVSNETLRVIASSCRNLHALIVINCPNIVLGHVILPMLTVLKLQNCKGITSDSMAAVAHSVMLKVLELDNCSSLTTVSLDLPHLQKIRLVHCCKFFDLNLRSSVLSSITISNCPSLQIISITSLALKKLVLQKQERLTRLALQRHYLQEVDLTESELLTDLIFDVFSPRGGYPASGSAVLDSYQGGCRPFQCSTSVSFSSSLGGLTLSGSHALTSLDLICPYLEHASLDGCDYLERATFSPVGLRSLNMGMCSKLNLLYIQAPGMVSLDLKACGVLSEAFIDCPHLTSLDASFCSQLKDDFLSATTSLCPLIESLVLMSCLSVGLDELSSLQCLRNLTYLDLSYTFFVNLQPVFGSCLNLKVLKLQACKYLSDTSLEPLYKCNALPALCELDLSFGTFCQSAIEELLACCWRLTHISLSGCVNMHDLDWGFQAEKPTLSSAFSGPYESSLENVQGYRLLQNLNCVGCPNIKKVVFPPRARCFHLSSLNLSLSSNLKEVDISCCNLSILNLSNCCSLEVLNLDSPKLISLFLQYSNVNEEAIEAAIMQCSMLETLDVRFCPKIRPSSMERLRAVCPSLKRVFSGPAPAS